MSIPVPRLLLCFALLPGLVGGIGGNPAGDSSQDAVCIAPMAAGEGAADQDSGDDPVVTAAPLDGLPLLHRSKCEELPAGCFGPAARRGTSTVRSTPPPFGEQTRASGGSPGFSVEIQHLRLLI